MVDVTTPASPSPRSILAGLEANISLFEPEQLQERLNVLDVLDVAFGHLDSDPFSSDKNRSTHRRAQAIRTRLEAINAELYRSIRAAIIHGAPHTLLPWIQTSPSQNDHESLAPGPAYDYRDELLSGILQLHEPRTVDLRPAREMIFYQPTPVRHIVRFITASALSEADILVDLGSGVGHVPLLASMLTGARSIGIEVEAAYVASAQECAQNLRQSRVRFLHDDARTADLSTGTVFYLYTPFTGSILADVLDRLRQQSTRQPIRICTFGPCTGTVAKEVWLRASAPPDPDQITVFESRL